jgi:hypothetical protein
MFKLFRRPNDDLMPPSAQLADLSGALYGLQAIVGAMLEVMNEKDKQSVLHNLKGLLGEGLTIEPTWLDEKDRPTFKNSMSQIIFSLLEIQDGTQPPQSN